ncbi:AsmA family protein [bacterium]|nr:AsmA family protein [bacterium]
MSDTEKPRKKRGCLGCLAKLFVLAILLIVGAGLALSLILPGVVKSQAETIGTQMLGTPVTISSVSLSIFGGSAEFKGIAIANYPGFSAKNMVSVDSAGGDLSMTSLLAGNLVIDSVWTTKPVVNLEVNRKGEQNLKVLMESLPKAEDTATSDTLTTEDTAPAAPVATPPVLLRKLTVSGIAINFIDDFAAPEMLTSSMTVGEFGIADLAIPSLDDKNATGIMTATVKDFRVRTPEHFAQPELVTSKSTTIRFDVGKTVATLSAPERILDLVELQNDGTAVSTETKVANENDPTPQNIREFILIAMNTSVPGEPKTFAQLDEEARAAKEQAAKEAEESETSTSEMLSGIFKSALAAEGEVSAAVAEEAPAVAPAGQVNQILVGTVTVTDFTFQNLNIADPRQNVRILKTAVDFKNFAWPAQKDLISEVAVRTHLLDDEGKVSLKVRGDLVGAIDGKRLDVTADVVNQQLAGLPEIESGRLYSTLKLAIENKRAVGELQFNTKGFKFAPTATSRDEKTTLGGTFSAIGQTVGKSTVETSLAAQEKSGAKPFIVPIDYSIESFSLEDLTKGLLSAITQNIGGSLKSGLEGIMNQAGELGKNLNTEALNENLNKATESLGDLGGKASESLDGVSKEADKAAKEVQGALDGLFGKKKKKDE